MHDDPVKDAANVTTSISFQYAAALERISITAEQLSCSLSIWEAHLGPGTGYYDGGFCGLPQSLQARLIPPIRP
jgi:hypothetical protein